VRFTAQVERGGCNVMKVGKSGATIFVVVRGKRIDFDLNDPDEWSDIQEVVTNLRMAIDQRDAAVMLP